MKIRIQDITNNQPVVRLSCGCLVQLIGALTNAAYSCNMLEDCRYSRSVSGARPLPCRVYGTSPAWVYDFEHVEYDPLATALAEQFG